uniref:Phosphatidic acid phosphatase type 2/haloperoxidase domain-containing protein n=1 Tax=Clastoptera arizonana TaxID=38151 RepID=A0A1B6DGX1_9HEMI
MYKRVFKSFFVVLLVLMECGIVPEFQNIGFYCEDPKISHKYKGDTISTKLVIIGTLIFPLFFLCGIEWSCHGAEGYAKRGGGRWAWLPQSLLWYREYISGMLIVFFLTDLIKVIVREPRPHFLDTCRPREAINCTSGYFSTYTCNNKELSNFRIRDASKSFPSGHAALSVYCFIFTAWFLSRRMCGVSQILVTGLQVLCLSWAVVCSFTRITDNRHHWWDVLAGSALGLSIGIYTVDHFCCCFRLGRYRNLKTSDKNINSSNEIKVKGNGHLGLFNNNTSARRLLPSTSNYSTDTTTVSDVTIT